MLLNIDHRTTYTFSRPVFLEPHTIRLLPRPDAAQQLLDLRLDLSPEPAGRWQGLDAEGNSFVAVWFDGLQERLELTLTARVRTLRSNPFGYLPVPGALSVPPSLPRVEAHLLAPCLDRGAYAPDSNDADPPGELASRLRGHGGGSAEFLLALNRWLFENLKKISRQEPGLHSPPETLARGEAACRDMAVLFMDCCRSLGIPARFVSGYHEGDPDVPVGDLHAWAEAWLPGAGWLGFDPVHGLAVADRHVALAASHDPALAAPVSGSFRGTGADSGIAHEVRISLEDES